MRGLRTAVIGVAVLGALAASGCATKQEVAKVRAENVALRDSLAILWNATYGVVRELAAKDTVPPPPCPPRCWAAVLKAFPAPPPALK
jgi:hypothetical protein